MSVSTPPDGIAMTGALTTDLYELTMAASYLHRGMTAPATFSLFARRLPARRGFLVAAGLVETVLVNQITYQTAVATKAARCTLAAGGIELVDFALRRTHGIEAGFGVARASAIAGFAATSNVDAARRFGLRVSGTMAHSYVEAFPSEEDAFVAFVQDRPGPVTFLVDTYDTMSGVDAAIRVMRRLGLTEDLAIRLDSGDLESLARLARRRLDAAAFPQVRIFVSGGLDEYDLERLRNAHAPIDAAGIGTRMGVSSDAPSLDSAYKLVAYAGRPVCKLSDLDPRVTSPETESGTEARA